MAPEVSGTSVSARSACIGATASLAVAAGWRRASSSSWSPVLSSMTWAERAL